MRKEMDGSGSLKVVKRMRFKVVEELDGGFSRKVRLLKERKGVELYKVYRTTLYIDMHVPIPVWCTTSYLSPLRYGTRLNLKSKVKS